MYFGGKKRRKKDLFVIVKFDAVALFRPINTIFFMKQLSLQVFIYCCMSANFNNIRFYNQWNSAVLLRTV